PYGGQKNDALTFKTDQTVGAGHGFSAVMTPARYADFLPDAQAIAAREHSPLARVLLVAIALLATLAIGWAAIAEVEKVTTAPGRVRPDSRVKIINHPEGGRIQEIYVIEGQRVAAGDPLVEFDPEFLDEEVGRLHEEWTTFAAQTARLAAESVRANNLIFPADLSDAPAKILANQRALFDARRAAFAANRGAAEDTARRFEGEVGSLRDQIATLRQTVEVRADQESRTRSSAEQGYFPQLRYLTIKNELIEAEGKLASRQNDLAAREAQLSEARGRVSQIEEDYFSDVIGQLVESRQQRDSLARELSQATNQQNRLIVRAPVDGIVQNLSVSSRPVGGQQRTIDEPDPDRRHADHRGAGAE
ncbi:MAG: biotin/lipoyl-binding protein, partial [Proteobacteria bacterium]|nr:biotin/lipoyl-binding protein [Pseudomonadota bacterium]